MPIVKNALLRYITLDKCFNNWGRKYYFQDLLEAVNEVLYRENPDSSGIEVRQLRSDIAFMRSEEGYLAPIETFQDGKKAYYRYSDKNFSINNSPLNTTEAEQLKNAISVLQRFDGAPGFEWVGEMSSILQDNFDLKDGNKKVMSFESNIDYQGYNHIDSFFNAIINERTLSVVYAPYEKECITVKFHPYYLKQYNNRWFLIGRNEELNIDSWVMPLDRIESFNEIELKYIQTTIDWEDYFYDIIGVTNNPHLKAEEVMLLIRKDQAKYHETKPLHPSQKSRYTDAGDLEVRIKVKQNFELEALILSFGDIATVIAPEDLKEKIKNRIENANNNY